MRFLLKWIGILSGVFVLTVAVAAAGLHWAFPPAKLRKLVEAQIQLHTGREAGIGTVHLGISGLTLDALRLSEIPNFRAGTFLQAEGVHLEWSWQALWQGFHWRNLFPSQLQGKLSVREARTPYYSAQNLTVAWDLQDVDPTLSRLNGWAHLKQGAGIVQNLDKLAASDKRAKLIFLPLQLLQNVQRLGLVNLGLPNLSHWPIQSIEGDYQFQNGMMKIKSFKLASAQLSMNAQGTIQLASGSLAVDVNLESPNKNLLGEMNLKMHVSGTLSNPKTDIPYFKQKAFKATLNQVLNNPQVHQEIDNTLHKLFH